MTNAFILWRVFENILCQFVYKIIFQILGHTMIEFPNNGKIVLQIVASEVGKLSHIITLTEKKISSPKRQRQ